MKMDAKSMVEFKTGKIFVDEVDENMTVQVWTQELAARQNLSHLHLYFCQELSENFIHTCPIHKQGIAGFLKVFAIVFKALLISFHVYTE